MKYRRLGRTGLTVSEIGFGAWGIGGSSKNAVAYGPTDDHESTRVLRRAFDLGVTFYDTADLYGDGHSERLIGAAFKDLRPRVVIASKVGMVDAGQSHDLSSDHIRASLEGTLQRLQTDYLDLYQLHDPPMEWLERDGKVLETLRALQRAGRIRAFGISTRSPDEAVAAIRKLGVTCLQVNFNILDQRVVDNGLMELCQAHDVGLIARTPLCFGFLAGAYSPESRFDVDDHRSRWPAEQRALWAQAYRLFSSVKQLEEQTSAQFALRYCLSYTAVSTVIPGMLKERHAEEDVVASHLGPLPKAHRLMVERIYKEHRFFLGHEARSATGKRPPVAVS